jgi:hypothetical protein
LYLPPTIFLEFLSSKLSFSRLFFGQGSRKTLAVGDMTLDSFYDGCEVTQGCVGCTSTGQCTGRAGQGCLGQRNCQIIANYQWLNGRVNFQLMGRQTGQTTLERWVALGLSRDANMVRRIIIHI